MGRAKFSQSDFLGAALAIASEHGPAAVTVASISERLKAPTGSFYHRFASRNVLLGALWLRTVLNYFPARRHSGYRCRRRIAGGAAHARLGA